MLPSMHDGLSALLMEVLGPFRRSSMCRHVHRELMRNELLDLITIVPTNACWQRNYVEAYSRSIAVGNDPTLSIVASKVLQIC
jgi:hypothetical protein